MHFPTTSFALLALTATALAGVASPRDATKRDACTKETPKDDSERPLSLAELINEAIVQPDPFPELPPGGLDLFTRDACTKETAKEDSERPLSLGKLLDEAAAIAQPDHLPEDFDLFKRDACTEDTGPDSPEKLLELSKILNEAAEIFRTDSTPGLDLLKRNALELPKSDEILQDRDAAKRDACTKDTSPDSPEKLVDINKILNEAAEIFRTDSYPPGSGLLKRNANRRSLR
ncbi:uncharacterized protein RCC_06720 [Ramularia collo-cygni]|uniref:Uncharacterized protein n=1 Tax=Ramularia collo-cygni TaxID=112498 RepID=A0A2D3V5Z3_9PEZI|nr:uncharacterized protein RCC_06720 [Ramularia collo-cygni]CZT20860.1 uncharacterized protein RCC_06720 [Ramularia collo-cygni]